MVDITYEWKPHICSKCGKLGHKSVNCKSNFKKVWVAKEKIALVVDVEGFRSVTKRPRATNPQTGTPTMPIQTNNSFNGLYDSGQEVDQSFDSEEDDLSDHEDGRGEDPPLPNG